MKNNKETKILSKTLYKFILSLILALSTAFLFSSTISIRNSLNKIYSEFTERKIKFLSKTLKSTINNRLAIINDHATLPFIVNTVMNPNQDHIFLKDFLDDLRIQGENLSIFILDIDGNTIQTNSTHFIEPKISSRLIDEIIEGGREEYVNLIKQNNTYYTIFAVPIKYNQFPEGVLLVIVPAQVTKLLANIEDTHINLYTNSNFIGSFGKKITDDKLSKNIQIPYINGSLKIDISKSGASSAIVSLAKTVLIAVVILAALFLFIFHLIGKKYLVEPQLLLDKERIQSKKLNIKLEKINKELLYKTNDLKKISAYKSNFLAMMSHEIRTPMNGVIGIIDLLRAEKITQQQTELLNALESSGNHLLTIVNDILDYSKIESGKMTIESNEFNVNKLIKNVVVLYSEKAKEKKIKLSHSFDKIEYLKLIGDPTRISQILNNIVSNAIKFTKEGEIKITVSSTQNNATECQLSICVEDTGIGIPKDIQKTIFNSFEQADTSISRKFGGTGLGLAISSRLSDLMGGKIYLESEEAKGSKFTLSLPLQISGKHSNSHSVSQNLKIKSHTYQELHILIAEDNEVNQMLIKRFLNKLNCNFHIVSNGKQAIEALEKDHFDIIFMDMQMPIMDGIEATKIIISKWGENSPTIIAMTANVLDEDRQNCMNAGMHGFLPKPISLKTLESTLCKIKKAA